MEMIKTVNLHKSFGDLHVLAGVNQTIHKGEVVSIIGPKCHTCRGFAHFRITS